MRISGGPNREVNRASDAPAPLTSRLASLHESARISTTFILPPVIPIVKRLVDVAIGPGQSWIWRSWNHELMIWIDE